MDAVFVAPDLDAFVGVSLSDALDESIQMNHAMQFTNVCGSQIIGICTII